MLGIFLMFFSPTLINLISSSVPLDEWVYDADSRVRISSDTPLLLKCYAIAIFIQGKRTYSSGSRCPLEDSINEAMDFFGRSNLPSIKYIKASLSRLIIRPNLFSEVSRAFQSIVLSDGQPISCDEKLFRFTGESSLVRVVPSKPDRIGFWIYEAVGLLANRCPYIVYLRLHDSGSKIGCTIPHILHCQRLGQTYMQRKYCL